MDERQFNALRSCEQAGSILAHKWGLDVPHFYLPNPDNDIAVWRAFDALADFLQKVAALEDAPVTEEVVAPRPAEFVDFTQVSGINDEIQFALYDAGYLTWEDILTAGILKLRGVSGIGMRRAQALFKIAQAEAK